METFAPGTGPPFSSVISPESMAPETCPRVGPAQKSSEAKTSVTDTHFVKVELQPLFVIIIPPGAPARFRFRQISKHSRATALRDTTRPVVLARTSSQWEAEAKIDVSNPNPF